MKIARVGLTVVCYIGGQMKTKTYNSGEEVVDAYEKMINSNSGEEVLALLSPNKSQVELDFDLVQKVKQVELTKKKLLAETVLTKTYKNELVFEQKENSIYMKGINLSIPKFLAEAIVATSDETELNALINFWKMCSMNPDPRARQDLFGFLEGGKFTLTPHGYFVAYRNVNIHSKGKSSDLHSFVSSNWVKVKGWKKSPKKYGVGKLVDGAYILLNKNKELVKGSFMYVGNLNTLYKKGLESTFEKDTTTYTDKRTSTFRIKVGRLVQMERKSCDSDPNQDCSYGLKV